jgi:membrane protein required for colicin V production
MYVLCTIEEGRRLLGLLGPVDLVILGLLLGFAALGFWSGFVWQIVRLVSLGVCTWVTFLYAPTVATYVGGWMGEAVRVLGSALGVFMSSLLVCYLVAYLFRDTINALRPKVTDRILGAALGLCKGALLIGLFAFLILHGADRESALRKRVADSRAASAMSVCVECGLPDQLKLRLKSVPTFGHVGGERPEQDGRAGRGVT